MKEISLSVCRDIRRMPILNHMSRHDTATTAMRETVISQARFGRRCFFCDFAFGTTDGYEIHHLDGDHTNIEQDNLAPVCELCHAPFHLDLVSRKWPGDSGAIIYLPEMTQVELNSMLQAIFFSMAMQQSSIQADSFDASVVVQPHTVYQRLLRRAEAVEKSTDGFVERPGLSKPGVLAKVLQQMTEDDYSSRALLLSGLRYLHPQLYFTEQASRWNSNGAAFSRLDLDSWKSPALSIG